VKSLNLVFDDGDFERLKESKEATGLSWPYFILGLLDDPVYPEEKMEKA
jgi:hypothetical protein